MNSPESVIDRPVHHALRETSLYSETCTGTELLKIARSLSLFFGAFLAAWLGFDLLAQRFPYVRNGASLIGAEKQKIAQNEPVFRVSGRERIVVFGHSKILSGFIPDVFDFDNKTDSYNLAVPGSTYFIPLLKPLIERGEVPDTILLIGGKVGTPPDDGQFHLSGHDQSMIRKLFPFRDFVRDGFSFLLNSRRRGGPAAYYEFAHQSVIQLRKDRGFYFIEGQSGYADHRLPNNFSLPTDRPHHIEARTDAADETELRYLLETSAKYGIRVFFIPSIFRVNERAAAPAANPEFAKQFKGYPFVTVAGPDYWVFPNRFFSDAVHLNPEGAREYTNRLRTLMAPYQRQKKS